MHSSPLKVAVFFCRCGGNVSDKVDPADIEAGCRDIPEVSHFRVIDFACGEEGKDQIEQDLRAVPADRVVVAACSPRDHEETFRKVLQKAGMNPYLLQMVNVREHISWVTENPAAATAKAMTMIRAAIARVRFQEPLEKRVLEVNPRVVVLGGGTAGLKCALTLAQAGRQVTLVEKTPVLGGLPVRFEEIFPLMECGPCMLEPVLADVLHGEHAQNIEILTLSELREVKGFFGNFTVKIARTARSVNDHTCIGCGECVNVCPEATANEYNERMDQRKAIAFPFPGALPNAPFIDRSICRRTRGKGSPGGGEPPVGRPSAGARESAPRPEDCRLCEQACPVPGTIRYDETDEVLEREAGAIVLATGAGLYDVGSLTNLGYGNLPGVYTNLEFERILAANGPTQGVVTTPDGQPPRAVGIFHCVGSLDPKRKEYCSGICCRIALKFNHLLHKKLPDTTIYHFFKVLVVPGKQDHAMLAQARENPHAVFVQYQDLDQLSLRRADGRLAVKYPGTGGAETLALDLAILCPAIVPGEDAKALGDLLEVSADRYGFFEELHGRMDPAKSKIRGVYLAGACQGPMDVPHAISQSLAVSGCILSELAQGKRIEIEPVVAQVDPEKCSGCRTCLAVCPFKAIAHDEEKKVAEVNPVLCTGCGTCVASCPSASITAKHFSQEAILAEIDAFLS